MFYLITPKAFTAVKSPISHLKGHKIYFLGKKNILFMKTNGISKKKYKKIIKISQIFLAQLEFCKNTLLCNSEVLSRNCPSSMTKYFVKTKKTIKSEINYDFFLFFFFQPKQKDRISVTKATAGQSSTFASFTHICIIATKRF